MEVNKVVYNGDTLLDLTSDTVTPQTLLSGATAHAANGQSISGTVDLNGKADKVANATAGNFAGLDANGNLTDSGKKATDFATASDMSDVQGVIPSTATTQNKLATAADTAGEEISSTATGVSITLTDSANGMVQGLTIKGRSTKTGETIHNVGDDGLTVQTTGKNLFDESLLIVGGIKGDTHTIKPSDNTWMVTKNCFLVKAGTYTVSSSVLINHKINVQAYTSEELTTNTFIRKIIDNSLLPQTFTLSEDTYIAIDIYVGTPVTSDDLTNSKIQLELGSIATAYEPYCSTSAEFTTALPLRSTLDETTRDELTISNGKAEVITRCEVVDDSIVPLATPITTPLIDAEISAFRDLKTYDSTTNITISDEPDFELDYLKNTDNGQAVANIQKDLQEQIDDKITVSPLLTLTVAGWGNTTLQQTVTFVHDTTKRNVIDVDPASVEEWAACGIIARYETASNITFTCKSIPENALLFKVTSMGV